MSVGKVTSERIRAAHLGPERRRPQVLDAALKIAVERGSHAVSMEAVAQRMEVTKPVVYACFGSREELLEALLEREEQRLFSAVLAALPGRPSFEQPEQLLVEGFQALLKGVASHADSWQLVFAASPDPAVADRYKRARGLVAKQVGALMAPGLSAWGIKDVSRKLPALVEFFMSAGDGAVRTLIGGEGGWSADELGALVGRMVYGALRKA